VLPTRYIFNHVPKTGGNSLLAICRNNLPASEISPHLAEHEIRLMPATRFEQYRLIRGHFSILTQARFSRSRYSMTLLRDPVRTIVSTYNFWRITPERSAATDKAKELRFPDFVRYFIDSPAVIRNPYTYHFAALGRDFPGESEDASSLLLAAKHNLTAFDFLGICEDFERSARLLCRELGWALLGSMPHENRSRSEDLLAGIDGRTMELLHECNRLDLQLYAYAVELFHARCEQMDRSVTGREPVSALAGSGTGIDSTAEDLPQADANRFVPFPVSYAPDRRASIQRVSARWVSEERPGILQLTVNFRVQLRIEDLIVGVLIYDAQGGIVWGTNSLIERSELRNEPGCECVAVFMLECELPAGIYFITAALSQFRRLGFHHHWIDRAAFFAVKALGCGSPGVGHVTLREFRSGLEPD